MVYGAIINKNPIITQTRSHANMILFWLKRAEIVFIKAMDMIYRTCAYLHSNICLSSCFVSLLRS